MYFTPTSDSTVSVSKIKDREDLLKGVVEIPSHITVQGKTYTVTEVGKWGFFGCDEVTDFIIPSTVTKLDIWAFTRCSGLTKVTVPESVSEIGYAAFENCTRLTDIQLPSTLKVLPERMFQDCEAMTT